MLVGSDELNVRVCDASDLSMLIRFENPGSGTSDAFFSRQERGESLYLVAWLGETPVGQCEISLDETGEIRNLHVMPQFRGQGIGSRLIREAEAKLIELARAISSIGVERENFEARRLYERLGYRSTGIWDTISYEYSDENGQKHMATETSEMLTKNLKT